MVRSLLGLGVRSTQGARRQSGTAHGWFAPRNADDEGTKSPEPTPVERLIEQLKQDEISGEFEGEVAQAAIDQLGRKFTGKSLNGAKFIRIALAGADFSRAKLMGCTFERCDLSRASFSEATCERMEIRGPAAVVTEPPRSLKRSPARYADFTDASLYDCKFERMILTSVKFGQASLTKTAFSDCELFFTDFSKGQSEEVAFRGSDLFGVKFESAEIHHAHFSDCTLTYANFSEADCQNVVFESGVEQFRAAFVRFSDATLSRCAFTNGALIGARFADAILTDNKFDRCDLTGGNFSGADCGRTKFEKCTLKDAKFIDADCQAANFTSSNLQHANFDSANVFLTEFPSVTDDTSNPLYGANFRNAKGLRPNQFKGRNIAHVNVDVRNTDVVNQIVSISAIGRSISYALTVGCLALFAIALSTPDFDLAFDQSAIKIPNIDASINKAHLFYLSPFVALFLFAYFHIYLHRYWSAISELPYRWTDGRFVDESIFPWSMSRVARPWIDRKLGSKTKENTPRDGEPVSGTGVAERWVCIFLSWLLVPFVAAVFLLRIWSLDAAGKAPYLSSALAVCLIVCVVLCAHLTWVGASLVRSASDESKLGWPPPLASILLVVVLSGAAAVWWWLPRSEIYRPLSVFNLSEKLRLNDTDFGFADVSNVDWQGIDLSGSDLQRVRGLDTGAVALACSNGCTLFRPEQAPLSWQHTDGVYRLCGSIKERRRSCPRASNHGVDMDTPDTRQPVPASQPVVFTVFFDRNSSILDAVALRTIEEVVKIVAKYDQVTITIVGQTDTVGAEAANNDLAVRRADAVKEALVARGLLRERILARGISEKDLALRGEDGLDSAANRRATVEIRPGSDNGRSRPP